MKRTRWIVVVMLVAVGSPLFAATTIGIDSEFPLRGVETGVVVTDDGMPVSNAAITVVYRPNSRTSFTAVLRPTDVAGRTTWTPRDAGIVTLEARDPSGKGAALASLNVAVRFGHFPARGLTIMIAAGILLFGGAVIGMIFVIRSGASLPDTPST
ncbi:MAG TPA: hypothetical protein VMT00_00775 [Thermoanaerobaculia bacterium]|nr:hypothetical protein [Thermoanaerobaculia bacterium]